MNNRTEYLQVFDFRSDFLKQLNVVKFNYGFDSRFQKLNSEANLSNENSLFFNTSRYPDGGTSVLNNAIYSQVNLQCTKNILLLAGSRYSISSLTASFQDTITIHLPFNKISVQNRSLSNSFQLLYKLNNGLTFNGTISNDSYLDAGAVEGGLSMLANLIELGVSSDEVSELVPASLYNGWLINAFPTRPSV